MSAGKRAATHTGGSDADDVRGDARLVDTVAAIQLVLAARGLTLNASRLLNMVAWLVESFEADSGGTVSADLFIEAIRATEP